MNGKRILLVHLAALGDCLMVTALARQIKHDFPGCHLTWAIGFQFSHLLKNNPFVDSVLEVPLSRQEAHDLIHWLQLKEEFESQRAQGRYDFVFYTQLYPENAGRYDGTTRSSTFRGYPGRVTVPVSPVLETTLEEANRAEQFARENRLQAYRHVVLFECTPSSSQSAMTPELALQMAENLTREFEDAVVIISSHLPVKGLKDRILDASSLSYRENLALSHHCTFFIGCSSGITWLLTAEKAKRLPSLQVLQHNALGFAFASVKYDLDYWKVPSGHIVEVVEKDPAKLSIIAEDCIRHFENAKARWDTPLKPSVWSYHRKITLQGVRGSLAALIASASGFRERNHPSFGEVCLMYVLIGKSVLAWAWMQGIYKLNKTVNQILRRPGA